MSEQNLTDLLRGGVIAIAKQPKQNPQAITAPAVSATFIEHDYHGRTAALWNAVYRKFGLKAQSIMFVGNAEGAPQILAALKVDPLYVGGGMGVGFKDEVVPHLDELDPLAAAVGAVNLVQKTKTGQLRGFNTDGIGYRQSLERLLAAKGRSLPGCRVLLLGAGGTANAIAMALAEAGAELAVLNRTVEKAESLARRVNDFVGRLAAKAGGEDMIAEAATQADVVINVSTKGAAGHHYADFAALAPASKDGLEANLAETRRVLATLSPGTIVSDVVLREGKTATLTLAEEAGLTTLDGVPMVTNQAVEAIWIVHGEELRQRGVTKGDIEQVLAGVA